MGQERKEDMSNNLARNLTKDLEENLKPKRISYEELLKYDDDKRYELIDGIPYIMASPRVSHQELVGEIYYQLKNYLKGKKCRAFISPLDVKLSGQKDDKKEFNVVQPDVMVICDGNKITEKNILGAPDLAVEILSSSNTRHDRVLKLNLYQKFGVKEYWIVSLEEQIISVYILNEQGVYTIPKAYLLDDKIKINVLKDCYIDLKEFCKENNIIVERDKFEQE